MRLDDSNKISFDYISFYTLTAIYKISLKINSTVMSYVANISKCWKYEIIIPHFYK